MWDQLDWAKLRIVLDKLSDRILFSYICDHDPSPMSFKRLQRYWEWQLKREVLIMYVSI